MSEIIKFSDIGPSALLTVMALWMMFYAFPRVRRDLQEQSRLMFAENDKTRAHCEAHRLLAESKAAELQEVVDERIIEIRENAKTILEEIGKLRPTAHAINSNTQLQSKTLDSIYGILKSMEKEITDLRVAVIGKGKT